MTSGNGPARVAIVDNHEIVRDGVAHLLRAQAAFTVVGSFPEVEPILAMQAAPDVVVLDLYLGRDDRTSIANIADVVARGSKVVIHTAEERPVQLRAAVAQGASGVSLKSDGGGPLLDVIARVFSGEFVCSSLLASALIEDHTLAAKLTERELEVLQNIGDGLTHFQVARRLGITEHTVRTHLRAIDAKYVELGREVPNTVRLVREASRDGWLE